jgi:hypothetical protein
MEQCAVLHFCLSVCSILQQLIQAGAVCTSIEAVIFSLLQDAKDPSFKGLLGVIKANASAPSRLGPPAMGSIQMPR